MIPNMFSSLEIALSHSPELILQAVHDQLGLGYCLPPLFNWELLGDTSHNRGALAFRDQKLKEGEAWTHLAIEVFDHLAETGPERRRGDFRRASMFSRATLTSQLGQNESEPYRSIKRIEHWFFASNPYSPAQLRRLSQNAENGDIDAVDLIQDFNGDLSVIWLLHGKATFSNEATLREMLKMSL